MFSSSFQGSNWIEVFTPSGSKPLPFRSLNCKSIKREYDKDLKATVVNIDGDTTQSKIRLPKNEKQNLQLTQPYLVLQLFASIGKPIYIEFVISDAESPGKWRLIFSSSLKDSSHTTLHTKLPLNGIVWNQWCNLCFHMPQLLYDNFRHLSFKSTDVIILGPSRLRKVFTLRDVELGIPTEMDFPQGASCQSLLFCNDPNADEQVRQKTLSSSLYTKKVKNCNEMLPSIKNAQTLDALDRLLSQNPIKPIRLSIQSPRMQCDALEKHMKQFSAGSREQKKVKFSASTKLEDGSTWGHLLDNTNAADEIVSQNMVSDSTEKSFDSCFDFTIQRFQSMTAAASVSAAVNALNNSEFLASSSSPKNISSQSTNSFDSPVGGSIKDSPSNHTKAENYAVSTDNLSKNVSGISISRSTIKNLFSSSFCDSPSRQQTGLVGTLHSSLTISASPSAVPVDIDVLPLSQYPCLSQQKQTEVTF